jgi:hypothetical protein
VTIIMGGATSSARTGAELIQRLQGCRKLCSQCQRGLLQGAHACRMTLAPPCIGVPPDAGRSGVRVLDQGTPSGVPAVSIAGYTTEQQRQQVGLGWAHDALIITNGPGAHLAIG